MTPNASCIALGPPHMPDSFRHHDARKYRPAQPIYTVYPDGIITVSQPTFLPGVYKATQKWRAVTAASKELPTGRR
jgi:hypothetical protein